ncbi:nitroreductase family protein [Clostridioides mangenotii]|uniref:nitroreductase family protein n=1 Tax=Metaclostridioides mangenotii TaxID=1540 RepID=UPI001C1266E5|nr:nitroreductase family protein [Clostridioides mangenotii]MBU5306356.1 nitroreductase family protein [Clostridioides mangenotii]
MDYKALISNRKSVRDFKGTPIREELLVELETFSTSCKKLVSNIGVEVKLFDNVRDKVSEKLQDIAGYKGNMIGAPNYIFILSEVADNYIENAGYIGESIVLKATELDIDSCWITFEDSYKILSKLEIDSDKEIVAIIALGYESVNSKKKVVNQTKTGESYSLSDMEIIDNDTSTRLGVEEIVYIDEWGKNIDAETLAERALLDAFNYARMAPSTLNRQPWRFIVDGGKVILAVRNDEYTNTYESKIDAGIVMLFFELIVRTTLFDTSWTLEKTDKKYSIPTDYKYIGYCNI